VILEVNGLSFAYKSRDVLRNIRFNVERGEVLAILGPNGVGKTTLLKCINAILRPCAGSVLVDSESVFSLGSTEIAHRIGYVAQRAEASRLIAFDAILMGRRPHIDWKVSDRDLAIVDGAIKLLDLGLPVEIHYYKGYPLILPLERDRKEDESCPAPSAKP